MQQFTTDIESELIDLSEMSLARLPTYDDPAVSHLLVRLLADIQSPMTYAASSPGQPA